MRTTLLTTTLLSSLALTAAVTAQSTVVTFDNGAEGWTGPSGFGGATTIDEEGGNPGANLHTIFNDFGINFRNSTNEAFVGDYTEMGPLTISFDMNIHSITDFSGSVPRPFVLELRDTTNPPAGYPWVSVYVELGWFTGDGSGWVTHEIEVTDVMSEELPEGWGGTGAEDPDTFMPILPEGRTWTNVLESVDEVVITTLAPGYFFSAANFDVALDNITITTAGAGCAADLNADKMVDGADLGIQLAEWGTSGSGDLNGDGMVDGADLGLLLAEWGPCAG